MTRESILHLAASGPASMTELFKASGEPIVNESDFITMVWNMAERGELIREKCPPGSGSGTRYVYRVPT